MKNFITSLNIRRIITLLLLAVSATAVLIFLVTQKSFVAELVQRGPKVALAQTDDYGFSVDSVNSSNNDYTFTPDNGCSGSCWNYVEEPKPAPQPAPQSASTPKVPTAPSRYITYEGGDCRGTNAVWVRWWSDGTKEELANNGETGECGTSAPAPTPVTWTKDQYGECDWTTNTVWNVEVSSTGERRRTNIARTNAPECGYVAPQAPQPTPQPAPQQAPQPAPQPNPQPATQTVVERTVVERSVIDNSVNGSYNTNINDSYNRDSAVKSPNAIVDSNITYTQPVNQQPAVAAVLCPDGYTRQVSGSSVTCIPPVVSNPTVRVVTAEVNCPTGYTKTTNGNQVTCTTPEPKVVSVADAPSVKELPKTGLPLAGWTLMGLLPIGSKLRKFGSEKEDLFAASSIWEEREFKKV